MSDPTKNTFTATVRVVQVRGNINIANYELEALQKHGYEVMCVSLSHEVLIPARATFPGEQGEVWTITLKGGPA